VLSYAGQNPTATPTKPWQAWWGIRKQCILNQQSAETP
jgi:hypothetical protein